MIETPAHGLFDAIRRPHPPGGSDRRHNDKTTDFLLIGGDGGDGPEAPNLPTRATARATSVEIGVCARSQRRGAGWAARCDAAVRARSSCVSFSLSPSHRCHFGAFRRRRRPTGTPNSDFTFRPRAAAAVPRAHERDTPRRPPVSRAILVEVGVAQRAREVKIDDRATRRPRH